MNAHQLWKITANPIDPEKRVRYKKLTEKRGKRFVAPPTPDATKNGYGDFIHFQKTRRSSLQPAHLKKSKYSSFGAKSLSGSSSVDISSENNKTKNQRPVSAAGLKRQFERSHAPTHAFDFIKSQNEKNIKPEPLVNEENSQFHQSHKKLLRNRQTDTILLRGENFVRTDVDNIRFGKKAALKAKNVGLRRSITSDSNAVKKSLAGKSLTPSQEFSHSQKKHNHARSASIFEPLPIERRQPNRSTFNTVFGIE
jgi:hypothetical protein